ncbi:MAG: hypothetical protein AB8H79_05835 [Myxococcota bacterium]
MSVRESLRQRATVANEDIDDIIGIAQDLHNAQVAESERATVDEVRAVADEMDLDPALVEQAIEVLGRQRAEAAQAQAEEQQRAQVRADSLKKPLLIGPGAVAATIVGVVILVVGFAGSGASSIDRAQADLRGAESALGVVLDRQASLAPQLVAMSGGSTVGLAGMAEQVRQGESTEIRIEASERLGVALAKAIGALPPAADPAAVQQRLDLQHEIVGAQNRITTEHRRVETARTAVERARSSLSGQLAIGLGLD